MNARRPRQDEHTGGPEGKTQAALFAAAHADDLRALLEARDELGDLEAFARAWRTLRAAGWSPHEIDAAARVVSPGLALGESAARGHPLDADEAVVKPFAKRLRLGPRALWWTGRRWIEAPLAHPLDEPDEHVPPETVWTLVRPLNDAKPACKGYGFTPSGWVETWGYAHWRWVSFEEVEAERGARGLADLFAKLIGDQGACLVRGIVTRPEVALAEDQARFFGRRTGALRLMAPTCPKEGVPGAFLGPHPIGRRGLIFDIDKAAAPEWFPLTRAPTHEEAERAIRYLADNYLPRSWRGCELAYRWSQSTGTRPWSTLSAHLGVWAERPIADEPLRRWVATWGPPTDPATFGTVQPIYTAAPAFDGAPDPLDRDAVPRVGFLAGELAAVPIPRAFSDKVGITRLVDGEAWAALEEERARFEALERKLSKLAGRARMAGQGGEGLEARAEAYAQGALRNACARIRERGPGERHAELRAAAAGSVGAFVKGGLLDEGEARAELLGAFVEVAGAGRKSEAERLIRDGFAFARETTMDELVGRLAEGK